MKTKQCFCQSIYNGETKQVENCTCGKCSLAINPVPTQMTSNEEKIEKIISTLRELPKIREAINQGKKWDDIKIWCEPVGISDTAFREFPNVNDYLMKDEYWVEKMINIISHSQKERVVEMCEEMKKISWIEHGRDCQEGLRPCGGGVDPEAIADRCEHCFYDTKTLSDLKTKIEEEI